ncbi:YcgN family cysteine cluster protein [Hahella sp. SMD15-11]|uniref:YcgN family cysteine cluster protein n=1 Tax=Thermohahella caldifontis TaxID=3142973 RepID=A0AB39UYP6_9GAMM
MNPLAVRPLDSLTSDEWEQLCDGCGKCCLNKLEDEDTGQIFLTRVACRYLDLECGGCRVYDQRTRYKADCIRLTPETLPQIVAWLPATCAYRLRYEGKPLPDWHPLVSGRMDSPADAGHAGWAGAVSEDGVPEEMWEALIWEDDHD